MALLSALFTPSSKSFACNCDSFEVAYSVAQLFREEADNEFSNKRVDCYDL